MVNNIIESILKTIKKSFSVSGRSNRQEFIIFYSLFFIYSSILIYFDRYYDRSWWLLIMGNVILLIIPTLFSLIVRRMHDLNVSAWWLLITFVPFGCLLFFALPIKKGTPGRNRFGEPPE